MHWAEGKETRQRFITGAVPLGQSLEVHLPATSTSISSSHSCMWCLLYGNGTEKRLLALGKEPLDILRYTVDQRDPHLVSCITHVNFALFAV